ATWQAVQPMPTVVSAKRPIGSATTRLPSEGGLRPRRPALGGGSGAGPRARGASEGGRSPPPNSSPSAPASRLLHVAHERLALVDGHVGVAHERRQLVDHITGDDALVAPVPRHPHLVDRLAVDRERSE